MPDAGLPLRLDQLARILDGELTAASTAIATGYAIDSRQAGPGSVFFALVGKRTDGHRYLDQVAAAGAVAAVVQRDLAPSHPLPCIEVEDTEAALGRLGHHFRCMGELRVIGITGSSGKTSTKEFTAALLATRFRVFKSHGNLNTTIGLPLALTRRQPDDEVAVLELGMSFPGELRRVAAIATPDIAMITNVGVAHIENFASADDVARAKAEILEGLRPGGTFVANADDPRVAQLAAAHPGPTVTFGIDREADVRARELHELGTDGTRFLLTSSGRRAEVVCPLVGRHHVSNVLAALAAGRALEVDPIELAAAVPALTAADQRGGLQRIAGDVLLLDDCYNANPASMAAALAALASLPGRRRLAVLGDMLELGVHAPDAHRELGRQAAGVADELIAVGAHAELITSAARQAGLARVHAAADADAAAEQLLERLHDGDSVLVKGSRGLALDRVVAALVASRATR